MSLPTDNYIIARNASEAERLNLQHQCIMSCQGYYLHPDVSIPSNGARIAELCTGTAVWAHELASSNPTVELHGFDISDIMFPKQESLATNLQLHVADIKQPFEGRWLGYFDVVHIRLIQAAMRKEEWGSLVRNVTTLLRPGGWLQWYEDDRAVAVRHPFRAVAPSGAAEAAAPSLSTTRDHPKVPWLPPRIFELGRFTRSIMPDERAEAMNYGYMNLDVLMADPQVGNLEQVGCDGFVIDREDDGGKLRENWAVMGISASWSMIKAREDLGAKIADIDRDEWAERAMKEIKLGGQWVSRAVVFTGRKKF